MDGLIAPLTILGVITLTTAFLLLILDLKEPQSSSRRSDVIERVGGACLIVSPVSLALALVLWIWL